MKALLEKLCRQRRLEREEWEGLLARRREIDRAGLFSRAVA